MPPFSLSNPWVSELPDTVGAHGSFGLPKKHPPSPAPPIWQPEYHKAYCTLKRGSRKSYMAKIWRSPSSSTFYGHVFVGWWIKTPPSTEILVKFRSTSSISPIRPIWKSRLLSRFFCGKVHVSGSPNFHPCASMFFQTAGRGRLYKVATLGFGEATPCLVQTRSWRSIKGPYSNSEDWWCLFFPL